MKKRVLTSVTASAVLLSGILFTGCFNSSHNPGAGNPGAGNPGDNSAMIQIQTENGTRQVNPQTGGTVVVARNNNGTNNVATVLHSELNNCASATTDPDQDGIICGPKPGVTYVFQSDFGKLGGSTGDGDLDNDVNTPDGGILLYDAQTYYNGTLYPTPLEGNASENRIQSVYIPTNYLKVTDDFKTKTLDEQYSAMHNYLESMFNMQCIATENNSSCCDNPYFADGKTKGSFVATYVMWFTRGQDAHNLQNQFNDGNYTDLEYLSVEFQLDVEQVDGNSSKLRFTSPQGTKVVFGGKKAGGNALVVTIDNDVINSVLHTSHPYVDSAFAMNVAKYFDKLIAKGDSIGVGDYAKGILVDNAQHPWPVKIYGTLHEINDDGSFQRSFVRNPGKLNATTFNLDHAGIPYSSAYSDDPHEDPTAVKSMQFCIVYPGGDYNKLH